MDKEYEKLLIENFINWLTNESMFEKTDTLELARMKAAWLEATRQADIRNSIK
jgi:hypothetical protein